MKAFVLRAPRKLEPVDLPVPEPGPGEVRVKIGYVGICGSDVEAYLGHRKPEFLTDPPMLGHEPSGIVDKVGDRVTGLKAGDRVAGVGTWGCYSEFGIWKPQCLLKLAPEIPLIDGSLIEVLPGIIMAARKTGITRAHDVLVCGQGLSGLQITRVVSLHGCKKLIATDLFDEKLELAKEFGATHTINAAREDVAKRVDEIVPGGVDVTIMATLDGNDVPKALDWTRRGGVINIYGSIGPCEGIDFFRVHRKAVSIVKETTGCAGVLEERRLWREAMQLVADGLLPTHRLRTHVFPMEKLPEAMELRATPRPDVIHVVMENDWVREKREGGEAF
ncbi:MAG: zinc-dependent alcohol dehydrogenase [Planctomycetota bacterium]|jgi:threonine dehydrogenase-like Zn-dependent dehydrogenase